MPFGRRSPSQSPTPRPILPPRRPWLEGWRRLVDRRWSWRDHGVVWGPLGLTVITLVRIVAVPTRYAGRLQRTLAGHSASDLRPYTIAILSLGALLAVGRLVYRWWKAPNPDAWSVEYLVRLVLPDGALVVIAVACLAGAAWAFFGGRVA